MASEKRIRDVMAQYFPECPICGSGSGYDVSSVLKGKVQCRSCLAEWSSLDFIRSTELERLRITELPGGAQSLVRGGHALKRYDEYTVGFWKSLRAGEERKAQSGAKVSPEVVFLLLILVLATYLRVANLDGFFSYDYDEGVYSESARMILKGNLPFVHIFSSQPPHFILFIAAFLRIFGMNIMAARLFIVVTSLIGIVSVHLIAKSIEDFKAGLVAAFVLSISPYFLRQSRSVQSEVPSIGFVLLGVWLFFKGFKKKDPKSLLLSGLAVCLGAMMKLNVSTAVPLILILLLADKNIRGTAFFMLGCIIPLLILPLFNLGKVIDQMVLFHFAKPATGTLQDRWVSIYSMLLMDVGLTIAALVGTVFCTVKKGLEGKFTVILTTATFLFLLYYRSYFQHQAVILVPLLAIMSGVALVAPVNLGLRLYPKHEGDHAKRVGGKESLRAARTRDRKSRVLVALVISDLMVSILYCGAAAWVVKYDSILISPKDDPTYLDAVKIIEAHADSAEYVITDEQILAFLAERDVPPDLADTSHMRISSGYLDSKTVIDFAKQYRVKVIILWTGRLRRLGDFVDYVKLNYQMIKDYGNGREIYTRP